MQPQIVKTISDRCKRCYSCVRECPAKAIKVMQGQAVVIDERCISCGHCVKVCSQNAKQISSNVEEVLYDILPNEKAVAIIAPSFAASYPDNYGKIPTALKKLGFEQVTETAFGADLISGKYLEIFNNRNEKTIISSPCPAVYHFIEKYHPNLVPNIAKVDSPMIAMGKYLKHPLGDDYKVVFIGPCVAKKSEFIDEDVNGIIDSVLTFGELNGIFEKLRIDIDSLESSPLDPPHAYIGKSFPLAGGLLKTAEISNDVLAKEVIVVEGKQKAVDIIEDIANGHIKSKFVDILFCEGCINGPAVDSELNYYSKRESVINFINDNIQNVDKQVWKSDIYNSRMIDFSRNFRNKNQRRPMPSEEKIREILAKTNKYEKQDELNCGACGYHSCRDYAIAIAKDLAEEEMCLPYLIDKLEKAYKELKETQEQLHNAEKLASIGQLASGVAHEINNPLGTIMLYSSMLKRELEKKVDEASSQRIEDLKLIIDEANRCKGIVSNLLNFARHGKLKIADVDVLETVNSAVKNVSVNPEFDQVTINVNDYAEHKIIEADADQVKQVFLNILNNACEAVEDSDIKNVTVNIKEEKENIIVEIIDTGSGISDENKKKLFTPFFTTKKMGKGTGLGLAISYGIIKMHKGDIKVKSNVGSGSVFSIKLPFKSPNSSAESNLEELFTNGIN